MKSSLDGPRKGRLVALEGLSEEALTVQLQLLPAAPHVLVLPRVQAYFADEDDGGPVAFDARRFVARVHAAAAARRAVALDFLSAAARAQQTVLLHGGTAASHALCIEAIRQHDPTVGGDLAQAARLFDELVASGLPGLLGSQLGEDEAEETSFRPAAGVDPVTRAMRAADALDRETEALQPSTHILDLTIHKTPQQQPPRQRARSLDLPIHGDVLRDLLLLHARPDSSPSSDCSGSMLASASPTSLLFPASMRLDALAAQQQEPGSVSPGAGPRRGRPRNRPSHPVASLGLNFLLAASREASLAPSSSSTRQTQPQTQADSAGPDLPTCEALPAMTPKPKLSLETSTASAPKRQPPPQRKPLPQHQQLLQYTDRGTDALPYKRDEEADRSAPLLPLVEDLVICFVQDGDRAAGHTSDDAAALDLAIQRCRAAGCARWQTQTQTQTQTQGRRRQQAQDGKQAGDQRAVSSALPETPTSGHGDNDTAGDYDPFAPHQYSTVSQGPKQRPPQPAPAPETAPASASGKATRRQPPTPAHTPPLPPLDQRPHDRSSSSSSSSEPLFRTITVEEYPTAMDLHNALRACLHASCLRRHEVSAAAAAAAEDEDAMQWWPDGTQADCAGGRCLWATPLLCGQPAASPATATTARGVDLILVVSSEDDGVPPVLAAHVRRRLDALGAAPHPATGLPCNGRLDIRYLVAQADRAWTAQHARSRVRHAQHRLLPPRPPSLLVRAALLLAQLDLYRRTSPAVRFVQLECPPAMLGLAAALQQLAGADLVQEAHLAAAAGRGPNSRDAAAGLLLTAPSTDADVKTFVEAVRRRLAAGSATTAAYYHPRPPSPASSSTRTSGTSGTSGVAAAAASRASAALSTATTAAATAATAATPVLRPGSSAADRARSPQASRLVAKTIQVPAAVPRRAKAVAFSGSVDEEKKTAFAESDEDLCERVGGKDLDRKDDGAARSDDDGEDADSLDLDLDDLDDLEIRRLMPLYLRDRAALLAAKDAAGATRSWGNTGAAAAAPASPASSFSSTLPASAPLLPSTAGPGIARPAGRQPKQLQPSQANMGMAEMQQHGTKRRGSSTRKMNSNNNGQKARRWLGLA